MPLSPMEVPAAAWMPQDAVVADWAANVGMLKFHFTYLNIFHRLIYEPSKVLQRTNYSMHVFVPIKRFVCTQLGSEPQQGQSAKTSLPFSMVSSCFSPFRKKKKNGPN